MTERAPHEGEPIVESPDDAGDGEEEPDRRSLIDRMRDTGVGTEDPNIVGDAGPTDIPPGRDDPGDGLLADPPDR